MYTINFVQMNSWPQFENMTKFVASTTSFVRSIRHVCGGMKR